MADCLEALLVLVETKWKKWDDFTANFTVVTRYIQNDFTIVIINFNDDSDSPRPRLDVSVTYAVLLL